MFSLLCLRGQLEQPLYL